MTPKQIELDSFENSIISSVFGDKWQESKEFKLIEAFKPGYIQSYIDKFETLIDPFMREDGLVNGYLLKKAVEIKSPLFAEIIPNREFRLSELSSELLKLLRGKI